MTYVVGKGVWVGFNAEGFPVLFARKDYYPTMADIDDMPSSVERIELLTDADELTRLSEVHRG